jgi:hypothetical protein
MRCELISRLDRAVTGENIAFLASVQTCIEAIDCSSGHLSQTRLMRVSAQTYAEIFENLSRPGNERVLVDENGAIDLRGMRLIPVEPSR